LLSGILEFEAAYLCAPRGLTCWLRKQNFDSQVGGYDSPHNIPIPDQSDRFPFPHDKDISDQFLNHNPNNRGDRCSRLDKDNLFLQKRSYGATNLQRLSVRSVSFAIIFTCFVNTYRRAPEEWRSKFHCPHQSAHTHQNDGVLVRLRMSKPKGENKWITII
jgi:hypothetical protein